MLLKTEWYHNTTRILLILWCFGLSSQNQYVECSSECSWQEGECVCSDCREEGCPVNEKCMRVVSEDCLSSKCPAEWQCIPKAFIAQSLKLLEGKDKPAKIEKPCVKRNCSKICTYGHWPKYTCGPCHCLRNPCYAGKCSDDQTCVPLKNGKHVCKPTVKCPKVKCHNRCKHGHKKDSNGCDTCACRLHLGKIDVKILTTTKSYPTKEVPIKNGSSRKDV